METLTPSEFDRGRSNNKNNGVAPNQRYPRVPPSREVSTTSAHRGTHSHATFSRKRPLDGELGTNNGSREKVGRFNNQVARQSSQIRERPTRQDFRRAPREQTAPVPPPSPPNYNGAIRNQKQGSVDRHSNGGSVPQQHGRQVGNMKVPPPPPPPPHSQQTQQRGWGLSQERGARKFQGSNRNIDNGTFSQGATQRQPHLNGTKHGSMRTPSGNGSARSQWDVNRRNNNIQVRRFSNGDSQRVGSNSSSRMRHESPRNQQQPFQTSRSNNTAWENRRRMDNVPPPLHVNKQPAFSGARNGRNSIPPPPPPRNSPPQQGRAGWSGAREPTFRGGEQKRPRNMHGQSRVEFAPLPAGKKAAFAGRFVPKEITCESYEKLRAKADTENVETKKANVKNAPKVNAVTENELGGGQQENSDATKETAKRNETEKVVETKEAPKVEAVTENELCGGRQENADATKAAAKPNETEKVVETKDAPKVEAVIENVVKLDGGRQENADVVDATKAAAKPLANGTEKMVLGVSPLLQARKHSLSDIVKDTITPELTDVSADLKTSASYSSCSVPHASVTPSVEVLASPHSLSHPDEVFVESNADDDKKPAASVIIDLPVQELLECAEQKSDPNGAKDTAEIDTPKEIVVTNSVLEEANVQAGVASAVANETAPAASSIVEKSNVAEEAPTPVVREMNHASDDDSDDSSDEETDEEELQAWARKMFGIPPPITVAKHPELTVTTSDSSSDEEDSDLESNGPPRLTLHLKLSPAKVPTKPRRRRKKSLLAPRKKGKGARKAKVAKLARKKKDDDEMLDSEEAKRKKEEAKPLTAAEVRKILAEDKGCAAPSSHWVRRSMRQPSRSVLNNPSVRSLVDKLRVNDYDMTVLKMKKYIIDPDTPTMVIDAALDALEENTNCQALYIQNFNEGMRDEQVLHLLKILQMPSCNIWCLNIGETYNVKTRTWKLFAKGLKKTKITHMYASEHTISSELKDEIRQTIRKNRSKHDMHCNPDNLDVIVQCTHCWWNPINTKSLRPYLSKRGMEHILHDKEAQGLQGSTSKPAGEAGTDGNL